MKRVILILTGLSLSILLLSLNRLTALPSNIYLQPYDFLRLVDFNAMLPIPLISVILYYLLKREIVYDSPFIKKRLFVFLNILLIIGIYFFAAGSGDHEITNYLNTKFCDRGQLDTTFCRIIGFNDDEFSHYVYYAGFILLNIPLMFFEYFFPRKKEASRKEMILVSLNGVFIALGIFANLAFEEIGIDLYVFGAVMLLSLYLLVRKNWQVAKLPILFYFALSYSVGVLGTLVYKLFFT